MLDFIQIRDHLLPRWQRGHRTVLREVVDTRHPRLFRVYWAIYDDAHRSDLWTYDPGFVAHEGGKRLGNLAVAGTPVLAGGAVLLRLHDDVCGQEGGPWGGKGVELTLEMHDGSLSLERVRVAYRLIQASDGKVEAMSEELVRGRYRVRSAEPRDEAARARCGLFAAGPDPTSMAEEERVVRCLLAQGPTRVTYRSVDSRLFMERSLTSLDAGQSKEAQDTPR